jgi:TonB family protein
MDSRFPARVRKLIRLVSPIPRPIGGFSVVLLLGFLCLSFGGTANMVRAANKIFVFHGTIKTVDTAARTFTLQSNKQSFLFVATEQTRIDKNGKPKQFADLKKGQLAEVDMQVGPGGKGMAIAVRLGFHSADELDARATESWLESQFRGTTPDGKTISWKALRHLVVNRPIWEMHAVTTSGSTGGGVFRVSVRPDGTVSDVDVLRSTGDKKLDEWGMRWAKKWRFRPKSVVQATVATASFWALSPSAGPPIYVY